MNLEARAVGGLIIAILVAGVCGWGCRAIYNAGVTSGRSRVQARWDADKLATQKLVAEQQQVADEKLAAAVKLNQEILDAYSAKMADVQADADDYARRLRNAQGELATNAGTLPRVAGGFAAAVATPPPSEGRLDAAVGARLAECDANEAQLTALEGELLPQIPKTSQ